MNTLIDLQHNLTFSWGYDVASFSAKNIFSICFLRVTPEPGLQFHANFNQKRRDVIREPLPEEHDLRSLREALFPGRY
jgi:hypothetical protein